MKDRYAPRMPVQCPIIFQSETDLPPLNQVRSGVRISG